MSYLYLEKQSVASGQRGIVCGNTFLPIPDRTVISSIAVTDGLDVYADGSSTTANIGTIVCSSQVTSSNGVLVTNSSTDETTGSVQLYGAVADSSATGRDFNGTLCLAVNLSGMGKLVSKSSSAIGFDLGFKVTTEGDPAAAGSKAIYKIYGPNSSDSTTNMVDGSIQRDLSLWAYLFLRASETASDKLDVYLTNNPGSLNKVGEIYKDYLFDVLQYEEEYRYHTVIGKDVFVGSSGNIRIRSLRLYNRRLSDAEMSNLVCELNATEQFKQAVSFTKTEAPTIGTKGIVIDLPEKKINMPSEGLVLYVPFDSNTTTAETGQDLSFRSSGIEFSTYKGVPSISMTRGAAAVSFAAAGLPTGNAPFTISVWFLNPSNNGQESIIIWGPETTGQMVFLNFHNGQLSLDTWYGDTSIDVKNLFSDQWQLLDTVYDGTTLRFYINTILVGSSEVALGTGSASTAYIGGHPSHEFGWSGRLSDLRVYNRALSVSELKALYGKYHKQRFFLPLKEAEGTPEVGTPGVLLNSKSAIRNLENDSYSHSNNIPQPEHIVFHAAGNSLEQADSGQSFTKSGTVALTSYKGIPGYQLSSSGMLSFSDAGFPSEGAPYTISLWAKADQPAGSESVLFMWGNLDGNGVALAYTGTTMVRDVGGYGINHDSPSNAIVHTNLNHIALRYDGQNSRIYVNGVAVSTTQISRKLSLQQGVIGATHSWGEYFSGFISSIRVFNTALSDEEIAKLANEWSKAIPIRRAYIPLVQSLKPSVLSRLRSTVAENKGKSYTTEQSWINFPSVNSSEKWIGGVLAKNGKIYCIPHYASEILVIDPTTDTATTIPTESGNLKWFGGCLAPNGKIYAIPHTSSKVLVIDPETNETHTFSGMGGNRKWAGGALGPDGKIYCIPNEEYRIGVIDPETESVETFGNVEINIGYSWKWRGGALGPDGYIYAFPSNYQNNYVLKINPVTRTTQLIEHGLSAASGELFQGCVFDSGKGIFGVSNWFDSLTRYSTATGEVSRHGFLGDGTNKWFGGCLAPNGKLYFAPSDNSNILEVDPDTLTTTMLPVDTSHGLSSKFHGAVVAPNGNIYFIPYGSDAVLKLTFNGLTPFEADVCESSWLNKF